jgi:hypothetical protein
MKGIFWVTWLKIHKKPTNHSFSKKIIENKKKKVDKSPDRYYSIRVKENSSFFNGIIPFTYFP